MKKTAIGLPLLAFVAAGVGCASIHDDSPDVDTTASALTVPRPIPTVTATFTPAPAKDQSFRASTRWALSARNSSIVEGPTVSADVNGDGKKDVVVFGIDGTTAFVSTGTSFARALFADFGQSQGWNPEFTVRAMADVNGDGKDDIVGFARAGTYVSLSTGTGFAPKRLALADFGGDQGWNMGYHERLLGDVDGDGKKDIVGFGEAGVYLSKATSTGFGPVTFVVADLGAQQGWSNGHLRVLADINGDGREDIVGFGDSAVWTALSTGTGFGPATYALADFTYPQGWNHLHDDIQLVDYDGDGKKDIVGFNEAGTMWARSLGNGTFAPVAKLSSHFGTTWIMGTPKWRYVADFNHDGYRDVLLVTDDAMYRMLGGPSGLGNPRMVLRDLTGYGIDRLIADADGDGLPDIVGVTGKDVRVAKSTELPPPAPPADPTGARVVSKTNFQVKIAWNDNATDERSYVVWYGKAGGREVPDRSYANLQTRVIGLPEFTKTLDPDTDYCFTLQAESVYGVSARSSRVCTRTNPGNTYQPAIDPGFTYVCGAPATCPAGYHAVDYDNVQLCPGDGLSDNRTLCGRNVDTFTACGSCPSGYLGLGGMSIVEYACSLPGVPSSPFGNASRCSPSSIGVATLAKGSAE